jgi:DNA-directed RNA polymerase specialized sigma24 family protein
MPKLARVLDENLLRVQFDKKVRDGIFDPVARRLPADIAEERLQDATCQTFELARRYALEKNKVLPDAILVRYCCLRAVDPGRHFIRCDGSQRLRDVLDFRNFANGRVEVLHLDGVAQDDDGELPKDGDSQLLGLAEAMSCSVERKLNSALDLEAWLHGLDGDERQMLAARAAGYTLGETATDLGCCLSTVFARTRQLGEELAARVGVKLHAQRRHRAGSETERRLTVAREEA